MEYVFLVFSAITSLIVNGLGVFRRRHIDRILVFKLDHLGDVVTATPALQYLRKSNPSAEITVVVGPWTAPLLTGQPSIDKLVVYASRAFDRGGRRAPRPNLRSLLPSAKYDWIVGMRDDWTSLRYCLVSGARRRTDRGTVRLLLKGGRILGAPRFGSNVHEPHEVETNLRIVKADPADADTRPFLKIAPEALAWVDREVVPRLGDRRDYVVLHPGAFSPLRRWSGERFAAVGRWVLAERGSAVVITGSADEAETARSIAEQIGTGALSLAGETTLGQAAAVVARARAMVSLDTGLMHVATAVGTPVVALVGPENPDRFGPYGADHVIVYHRFPCSPCDQVHCVRKSPECMESIEVSEVIDALANGLARGSRTRGAAESIER